MTMTILINEIHKGFKLLWNYRYNSLAELILMSVIFIGLSFFLGRGEFNPDELATILLGYLVWFYAIVALSNMSYNLTEEARSGTLEQMYMSPVPITVIVLGRVVAMLITATIQIMAVALMLIVLLQVPMPMRWQGIPIFILTIIGLIGAGFMLGGFTLIYKQIAAIANLVQNLLIFINGTLLPVTFFPDWLEFIARLMPSTQGIIVLRAVVLDGQSLAAAWNDFSLIWLILNTLFYVVAGALIFQWCSNIAREQGSLGHY